VAMLENWRGDGIIANFDDPKLAEVIRRKRVPAVGFGGGAGFTGKRTRYLATDDIAIGVMGAEHLLERGFTRFGYCAMPRTSRNQPWSECRGRAFQATVEQAGWECSVFCDSESVSLEWGRLRDALCQWIESLQRPIGVMAAYDMRAFHILEACRELNIRIPEEVAVLGVDNHELVCELAEPSLSSIIQGGFQVGAEAARLLDCMMAGEASSGMATTIPPVGVAVRSSTDILAIEDDQVAGAIRYIRQCACDGIQVTDVVNRASVSRVTLENRFKRVLGRTLHAEIKRVQIDRVKELLRTTDLPMHRIAQQSGFEYVEYLSNLFRRLTDMTPGQYRQLNRQKQAN
ncbi:MAG: XylR family transcriptional regulator, partial [Bythopirellula sp.]